MSASVASKNIYELLGNDPEEDDQPTKAPREVVKNVTSSKKKDEKPVSAAPAARNTGRRGGRFSGNEGAFRDREAGRDNNRTKTTADGTEGSAPRGGAGRGRGGRGPRREFDRHSGTGKDEHEKQVAHGWGANKGDAELSDELAGAELAKKDAAGADPADPNAAEAEAAAAAAAEEEEKTKTYDQYLAELAEKKAGLQATTEIRRANEGTRENKKWESAKAIDQTKEQEAYFAGDSKDKSRNRERKTKNVLELPPIYAKPQEARRGGAERGGRGGDRPRGGRGDRAAPRGDRAPRGGRAPATAAANINLTDSGAFPALGA